MQFYLKQRGPYSRYLRPAILMPRANTLTTQRPCWSRSANPRRRR